MLPTIAFPITVGLNICQKQRFCQLSKITTHYWFCHRNIGCTNFIAHYRFFLPTIDFSYPLSIFLTHYRFCHRNNGCTVFITHYRFFLPTICFPISIGPPRYRIFTVPYRYKDHALSPTIDFSYPLSIFLYTHGHHKGTAGSCCPLTLFLPTNN